MKEFINNYEAKTGENFVDRHEEIYLDKFEHTFKAGIDSKNDYKNLQQYLKQIQDKCREKWSTFNINICVLGILLIVFSIVNLLIFLVDDTKSSEYQKSLIYKLLKSIALMFCVILVLSKFNIDSNMSLPALWIMFNIYLFLNLISNAKTLVKCRFFPSEIFKGEHLLYFLMLLIPFSNSYIVQENISLRFILISTLFYELFTRLRQQAKVEEPFLINRLLETGSICVLLRFTSLFYTCREEALLLDCKQNIFSTQITKISFGSEVSPDQSTLNFSFVAYLAFISFNYLVICAIIYFLVRPYFNKKTFSSLNYLILFELFIFFCYWTLQLVNNAFQISHTSQLNQITIKLPLVFYVCFTLSLLKICMLNSKDIKPQDSYLSSVTYMLVNSGLLISILSGESALSIWILILILKIYAHHRVSWTNGKI